MPKVMMIGKVSKLKSRTRRAGSFKGSLGTVVLEGSRAQSRRYGMGNIAGSPAEHFTAFRTAFYVADNALREMLSRSRGGRGNALECQANVQVGATLLRAVGRAEAHLPFLDTTAPRATQLQRQLYDMARQGSAILDRCALRGEAAVKARRAEAVDAAIETARAKGTMSGARRRRRR